MILDKDRLKVRKEYDSPCRVCTHRHVGCHVNCTYGYKEFKDRVKKLNKKLAFESELHIYFSSAVYREKLRNIKA